MSETEATMVWTLTVAYRFGSDIRVFRTEQSAREALAEYVRQSDHDGDFTALSDEKTIDAYFDDNGVEWYGIESRRLED